MQPDYPFLILDVASKVTRFRLATYSNQLRIPGVDNTAWDTVVAQPDRVKRAAQIKAIDNVMYNNALTNAYYTDTSRVAPDSIEHGFNWFYSRALCTKGHRHEQPQS